MERTILIVFLAACLLPATMQAQVWAPPQAHWTFNWSSSLETGYVELNNVANEVVGGVLSQRLVMSRHIFNYQNNAYALIYSSVYHTVSNGDLAMIWTGTRYDTLYWFGAAPGDHWTCPLAYPPGSLTVSDTGSTVLQGLVLRYLAVVHAGGAIDTIYERFGSKQYYLEQQFSFHVDPLIIGLRCYSDTLLDLSTGIVDSCDFILSTPDRTKKDAFTLWPNPGGDQFSLRTSSVNVLVTVRDAVGRIVYGPIQWNDQERVPTAIWPAGLYAIAVESKDQRTTLRWLKQ